MKQKEIVARNRAEFETYLKSPLEFPKLVKLNAEHPQEAFVYYCIVRATTEAVVGKNLDQVPAWLARSQKEEPLDFAGWVRMVMRFLEMGILGVVYNEDDRIFRLEATPEKLDESYTGFATP